MLDIENGIELFAAVCCCEKCAKVLIRGPHPPSLLVATKSQCAIALGKAQQWIDRPSCRERTIVGGAVRPVVTCALGFAG
jgi:hypothetical protein